MSTISKLQIKSMDIKKKKWRRAWTPGRFCEVATGALRLLQVKALAQNVQDYLLLKKSQNIVAFLLKKRKNLHKTWSFV